MLSQMKNITVSKLEGKRQKQQLISSSSLSGMSHLSNSSEEALEPLVHKPYSSCKSDRLDSSSEEDIVLRNHQHNTPSLKI
ncbi:hypothetical protein TKK_0005867 [Trichogramma kaykai]|uniref:Uncharacterized protein n=1 Tax=Trichogramma kaykai TaxID=54128 RepID=A0ABD2XFX9_9HYME